MKVESFTTFYKICFISPEIPSFYNPEAQSCHQGLTGWNEMPGQLTKDPPREPLSLQLSLRGARGSFFSPTHQLWSRLIGCGYCNTWDCRGDVPHTQHSPPRLALQRCCHPRTSASRAALGSTPPTSTGAGVPQWHLHLLLHLSHDLACFLFLGLLKQEF